MMGIGVAITGEARLQRLQNWSAKSLGLHVEEWQVPRLARLLDGRDVGEAGLEALEQGRAPRLRQQLIAVLAHGESYFFRHARQFEILRNDVLPGLLAAREAGTPLRVLSVGCASGEEAYSLAILLAEACQGTDVDWQIEAIDLCESRLAHAGAGRYGDWSLRATPGALRRQGFVRHEAHYEVLPGLRERVHFSARNLCDPASDFWAEPRFDLVFCRHVLSRLTLPALDMGLSRLAAVLRPGGSLFLGANESLRGRTEAFATRGEGLDTVYHRLPGADASSLRSVAARLTPSPSPLWVRTGRETVFELWRQERLGQALHLADSLTVRDRNDSELLLAQVMLLLQLQRVPEAQRLGVRLLANTTTPAMGAAARHAKALGHELRAELDAAEENYRHAVRLDPDFALPHLQLGLLARQRGDDLTARQELERALELLPLEDDRRLLLCGQGRDLGELLAQCQAEQPLAEPA